MAIVLIPDGSFRDAPGWEGAGCTLVARGVAGVLPKLKNLKLVSSTGITMDHIPAQPDVPAARVVTMQMVGQVAEWRCWRSCAWSGTAAGRPGRSEARVLASTEVLATHIGVAFRLADGRTFEHQPVGCRERKPRARTEALPLAFA
jgi:hypothetical protein